MFRYGVLLSLVGTIVCVTTEAEKLPYKPVCGTDGKTYTHIDLLNEQNTEDEETPREIGSHQERIRRSSTACSTAVREVCGTDGVTYRNPCELNQAYTPENNVTLSNFGPCSNHTIEILTNETNDINNALNEESNGPLITEDLTPKNKLSDVDSMQVANNVEDKNEAYVENVEDVQEVQNDAYDSSTKIIGAGNKLDSNVAVNRQIESKLLNKTFVDVLRNTSEIKNAQMVMYLDSAQSVTNIQNASGIHVESTSVAQNENESDNKNLIHNGLESYTKNGKKSRKRRNVQNPSDAIGNEQQSQTELKQDRDKNKSEKSKKHHTSANFNNPKTETVSKTEIEEKSEVIRNGFDKYRKPRNTQTTADVNSNNMQENFETKKGKLLSKNGKNKPKTFNHEKVEHVDKVQRKTKDSKRFEESRKQRDVKNEVETNKNEVQSKNKSITNSDHVRVARKTESKTNKKVQHKSGRPLDEVYGKVRKTRDLKKLPLSKKKMKPARSVQGATSNNMRGNKFGSGKK